MTLTAERPECLACLSSEMRIWRACSMVGMPASMLSILTQAMEVMSRIVRESGG